MQQIHWFPGHMAKAKRQMEASLKQVDVVLELVDARLPRASSNPMIAELAGRKPLLRVMTRIDLADAEQTQAWERQFGNEGVVCLPIDAKSGAGVQKVLPAVENLLLKKRARDTERGIRPRAARVMVVGIPNVGKSSFINRMAQRASTRTGDRPGVTKTQQWIRLGNIALLDTPGVLWPKLEDQLAAYKLAISGAIKSDILDAQELAAFLIVWLGHHYPQCLKQRYEVNDTPVVEWTGVNDSWTHVEPVLEQISRRRGLMKSGGVCDLERSSQLVIRELQTGKLGRISLEWPQQIF